MTEDGRRLRLQGVSLPALAVRPDGASNALRRFFEERLAGRDVWFDAEPDVAYADDADSLVLARPGPGQPSFNQLALEEGLAVFCARSQRATDADELFAATERAQDARRGLFARTPRGRVETMPYLNGAVLALYDVEPQRSYDGRLDELKELGFRHVCLLLTVFVANAEASRIDRRNRRTVRDFRLVATIRAARERGMSVMLLPIVLLQKAGEDDWRGTLRPKDEQLFWIEYDRLLAHYLDIAEATGVELFSIGSELGSLEDRTETWYRLIQNARGRFTGLLTYSANWDHAHVPRFFDRLDVVGVTGYFSLTDRRDPSVDQLADAWRRVGAGLRRTLADVGRPVVITELGYCSQDGANREPWNYVMNRDRIDLAEQADCFAAFARVATELEYLHGAYWFEVFEDGGTDDPGYSPRGKPALEHWRRWARSASGEGIRALSR